MKKILFLLTSLLAVSSALFFAGCNTRIDSGILKDRPKGGSVTVEESDDGNDDICPDRKKHGMPKVRFEFKDGRPARKH